MGLGDPGDLSLITSPDWLVLTQCPKVLHLLKGQYSHSDFRQLFLGKVERVVDSGDAVYIQAGIFGQVGSEDGVVGHVHEGHHGMPALVVVPHLQKYRMDILVNLLLLVYGTKVRQWICSRGLNCIHCRQVQYMPCLDIIFTLHVAKEGSYVFQSLFGVFTLKRRVP